MNMWNVMNSKNKKKMNSILVLVHINSVYSVSLDDSSFLNFQMLIEVILQFHPTSAVVQQVYKQKKVIQELEEVKVKLNLGLMNQKQNMALEMEYQLEMDFELEILMHAIDIQVDLNQFHYYMKKEMEFFFMDQLFYVDVNVNDDEALSFVKVKYDLLMDHVNVILDLISKT
ncbi:MAG: hypothetical protein EZS28_046111 [Streblomastix strix]|uniref:Uncharacterized protein n=1 Tax=Streblomastix strix TaxID=222440 RepID=A0A5J4TKD6_9EUKA|nr:MAG: hypothetical protein EZS28_046111 [Streblomastix strix]